MKPGGAKIQICNRFTGRVEKEIRLSPELFALAKSWTGLKRELAEITNPSPAKKVKVRRTETLEKSLDTALADEDLKLYKVRVLPPTKILKNKEFERGLF
jgi:hypothetical protein